MFLCKFKLPCKNFEESDWYTCSSEIVCQAGECEGFEYISDKSNKDYIYGFFEQMNM